MRTLQTIFLLLLSVFSTALFAQEPEIKTQIIKGMVTDVETKQPIIGATVYVVDSDPAIGGTTNFDGEFSLMEVPVGRQILEVRFVGYEPYRTEGFIVNTAKEPYLEIEMHEAVETTGEVVIKANENVLGVNRPLNELSVVSTRSFTAEETERVAGSLNDPGRMVMAFPGVQANQDNENDIVIRGNSSVGLLWRIEGMDIQTTSHFARPGTTGGGVSALSTSVLGTSDFSTGAYAAEYGNSFSGAFDLRFRKGNKNEREFTFKAGVLGLDLAAEGPIKKGKSSYLINYRYSTLGILSAFGFNVVRENVSNTFQDLSFNFYFSSPDNKHLFTFFGLGGIAREQWTPKAPADWTSRLDYLDKDQDSDLGVTGVTHTWLIDDKSYLKTIVGGSYNNIVENESELSLADTLRVQTGEFATGRLNLHTIYSRKLNNKLRMKAGLMATQMMYKLNKQDYRDTALVTFLDNVTGSTQLLQGYAQMSFRPSAKLMLNAGVHASLLALNGTGSVEPRASMRYELADKTAITAAYGLHAQMLPVGMYLLDINGAQPNMDLKYLQSHQGVVGFEQIFGNSVRLLVEGYYQYLFNVPVDRIASDFWFLNERDGYGFGDYVSEGTGRNFGVDLSVEKTFSNHFFALGSASLKRSFFTTLNGEEQSTRMDNIWNTTLMGGYEFEFKDGSMMDLGLKSFLSGGLRYTPLDLQASSAAGRAVYSTDPFSARFNTYFRLDTRIAYRKSAKKIAYTFALEIQNTTNAKNLFEKQYDRVSNTLVDRFHSGLTPALFFTLDF